MKTTKDEMRKLKIYNDSNYANGQPHISYRPQITGRMSESAAWIVYDDKKVIPGPWYNYGRKVFNVWNPRQEKQAKLLECIEYFKKTYNVTELAKTPFGGWMDAEFVKARNEEIKKALKSLIPD